MLHGNVRETIFRGDFSEKHFSKSLISHYPLHTYVVMTLHDEFHYII